MRLQAQQQRAPFSAGARKCPRPTRALAHDTPEAPSTADTTRRQCLASVSAAAVAVGLMSATAAPAQAANAIAEFWKSRQRQGGGIKLLAPLRVAQSRLQEALDVLDAPPPQVDGAAAAVAVGGGAAADALALPGLPQDAAKDALQLVRASSLNCYVFEPLTDDSLETRASLFTQQFVKSADPCTFRIILKTVTGFSSEDVRLAADAKMDDLVLGYQKLDAYLDMARMGNVDALPKAREQLKTTLAAARDIEAFVTSVLGV